MAESKFLESSRARSELLREKHDHIRQSAEERSDFWFALKSYLARWNERLDGLDKRYAVTASLTEDDKRNVQLEISRLKDELSSLRKRCLSSGPVASDDENKAELFPCPPDSLPFGDLRLLHEELQKHQMKLDKIKAKLLPKGKFVFRRYREAVEQLRAQGLDLEKVETATIITKPTKASSVGTATKPGSSICDLSYSLVQVDEHGVVRVQPLGEVSITDLPVVSKLDSDGSVVLSGISHSTIELHGSYPAIHIIDVTDSTISVSQVVTGAVHVTACHRSGLSLRAHQLRLHESTDLKCYTAAATIMEDCRRIHFYYGSTEAEPDIKDFSFLKEGVPSPNFVMEQVEDVVGSSSLVVVESRTHAMPASEPTIQTPALEVEAASLTLQDDAPGDATGDVSGNREDDEDEL